jgi:uncharacterized membrane protein
MDTSDLVEGGGVAAIVIAITQVIKPAIANRYRPLVALLLGVLIGGGLTIAQGEPWTVALMKGVVMGLVASGTYDQKAIVAS